MHFQYIKIIPILLIALAASIHSSCSAPQSSKDAPAASTADKTPAKKPLETEVNTGCTPTAANNYCKPTTDLTGAEKCWAKVLGTDAASKCASAGKVYNRILSVCLDTLKLKAPCTEADVTSAFVAANFNAGSIASSIQQVKDNIKAKLGVDAELDQCGETTTKSGKTVLIPIFLGKKFTGGAEGNGDYMIHAGKVCDSSGEIPACQDANLAFPDKSAEKTPVGC